MAALPVIGAIGSVVGGGAQLARSLNQPDPQPLRPNQQQPSMPQGNGFQMSAPPLLQAPQQQDLMSILQQISQRSL
jgi:hypothetical protein